MRADARRGIDDAFPNDRSAQARRTGGPVRVPLGRASRAEHGYPRKRKDAEAVHRGHQVSRYAKPTFVSCAPGTWPAFIAPPTSKAMRPPIAFRS